MKFIKLFLFIFLAFLSLHIFYVNAGKGSGSVVVTVTHASCTGTPWGTMASGTSKTAYATATVPYGSTCTSQTRTCSNGTLSGSYAYTSCSVNPVVGNCVGSWSACSNGTQTYTITTPASNGGTACPATNGATKSCGTTAVCSATHFGCSVGTSVNNVSGSTTWTWNCNSTNGGKNASCSENRPAMTGSVTASNCTIASGGNSCSTSISWSTSNPVATSSITTPTNVTVATGNSGSKTYSFNYGTRTFYLYNNAVKLGTDSATASCVSGTKWDGNKCAPIVNGGWSSYSPTSSCPTACGYPASTLTRTCTNPAPANGGATCSGSSTLSCPATSACLVPRDGGWSSWSPTSSCPTACGQPASTLTRTCTNPTPANGGATCSGSSTQSCSATPACPSMTGNINATDCPIAIGSSSCNTTLSWSTTNPVGTSSVTTPTNITVATANSNASKTYSIGYGTRSFYLYNNGIQLDSDTATASCVAGSSWNGSSCAVIPLVTSGWISSIDCPISEGSSSCNTTLTWGTTNPIGTSAVTTPTNITVASANSSAGKTYSVSYGNRNFYLYNNGDELDSTTANASCKSGTEWDGSKCVAVTTAIDGAWDNGTCGQCDSGCRQSCTKLCNNPAPANGGANCPGDTTGGGVWNYSQGCTGGLCTNTSSGGVLNITFTATPDKIFKGKSAVLTWTSNADSCVGTGFDTGASSPANGSVTVSPAVTTTYKITCTGTVNESKETSVKVSSITIIEI